MLAEEYEEFLALHALCGSADATPEQIQVFLDLRVDVNAKSDVGMTPLHQAAARNENPEVFTLLIKAEADMIAIDGRGDTPLHFAAGGKLGKDLP